MIVTTATAAADWCATSHTATTVVTEVTRKGRKWGEIHETSSEGRAIGYRRLPDGSEDAKCFRGSGSKDDAWRWVIAAPVSWDLVFRLQEEAVLTCPF